MVSIFATLSHWKAKSRVSEMPRGSAIMRRTWAFSTSGFDSSFFSARDSSSSSGRLLHRKNDSREASSRSFSGREPCFDRRFGAIQEVRADEDRRDRLAHAAFETVHLLAVVVEAHQGRKIFVGHRTAESLARDPRDDLLGAGTFIGSAGRLAREDLLAGSRSR